jgi:NADP-dependent 3-hydroxy acid dehydrogenase YdfG
MRLLLLDVRASAVSSRAVAGTVERFGRIDLLVSGTGLVRGGPCGSSTGSR